jgi:hypothetical protein
MPWKYKLTACLLVVISERAVQPKYPLISFSSVDTWQRKYLDHKAFPVESFYLFSQWPVRLYSLQCTSAVGTFMVILKGWKFIFIQHTIYKARDEETARRAETTPRDWGSWLSAAYPAADRVWICQRREFSSGGVRGRLIDASQWIYDYLALDGGSWFYFITSECNTSLKRVLKIQIGCSPSVQNVYCSVILIQSFQEISLY